MWHLLWDVALKMWILFVMDALTLMTRRHVEALAKTRKTTFPIQIFTRSTRSKSDVGASSGSEYVDENPCVQQQAAKASTQSLVKLRQDESTAVVPITDHHSPEITNQQSDALQETVSALYCKVLIILGLAFPMAEVMSAKVPQGYYQLFYVYLYLGSLLFLASVYIDVLRTKAQMKVARQKRRMKLKREQLQSKQQQLKEELTSSGGGTELAGTGGMGFEFGAVNLHQNVDHIYHTF